MRIAALTFCVWVIVVAAIASITRVWGDAALFVPRSHCGQWGSWAVVYQAANVAIALSYLIVTVEIGRVARRVSILDRPVAFLLVLTFLSCGLGHLVDGVLMFYWPNYRVATIWHLCTALTGLVAAITFPLAAHRMWSTQVLDDSWKR